MVKEKEKEKIADEFTPEEIIGMSVKERIIRISNEITVKKTGWNDYGKYHFLRPEDVLGEIKPMLLKYRLFDHFNVRRLEDGRNEATLAISAWDTDMDTQVYSMNVPDIVLTAANAIQCNGGLRTFCTRYLMMSAFNVIDDADDFDSMKPENTSKPTFDTNKSADKTPKKPDKAKDEFTSQYDAMIKLCQEKAKIDKEKVNAIVEEYEPTGKVINIKNKRDLETIKAIMNKLEEIK